MKRHTSIIFLVLLSFSYRGYSNNFEPLINLINDSEIILKGVVLNSYDTDSLLKDSLKVKLSGKLACWDEFSKTIKVKIITVIKGEIRYDTIFFPYHYNFYQMIPNYSRTDTLLFFVNKLKKRGYYGRLDLIDGIKSYELDTYINYIERYLLIIKQPVESRDKLIFDWHVSLACNPFLSWEATKGLKDYDISFFDSDSKNMLRETLLSYDLYDFKNRDLLVIVSRFGKNVDVINYCIKQLENIIEDKNKIDYSIGFMRAINDMDNRKEYKKLIKEMDQNHNDKITQLEIVKLFIKKAKKHYAQQRIKTKRGEVLL